MTFDRRQFLTAAGAAGLAGLTLRPAHAQTEFLVLRGGGNTGSWFSGSAVIAKNVTQQGPNYNMTATLGGGVKNPTDIQAGEAHYAYANARSTFEAYEGLSPYDAKHDKLRGIVSFFPTPLQIAAHRDAQIETFSDLIGKKVAPGQRGFSTAHAFGQLVQMTGHSMSDVEVFYLNYADANQAFQDRQVDAVMAIAGIPSAQYDELAQLIGIRMVPLEEELIERYVTENPGYVRMVIPAGTYQGWEPEAATVQSPTLLITSADRPDEEVYDVTKIVWESREELVASNPGYERFLIETVLDGISVPLHEGARQYWREIGVDA